MTDFKSTKTAIALGNFDGLHKGHADVINSAVKQSFNGLVPYVLIFDQHPQQVLTGRTPRQLMTYNQLKDITGKMGCGILHISFDEIRNMSPEEFVKNILADKLNAGFISCGFNYRFGKNGVGDTDTLTKLCSLYDIEISISDAVEYSGTAVSSTRIRKEIENGNIEDANNMLGRYFSYDSEVVSGDQRGRTLGFPTMNQFFPENFIVPKYGVYASKSFIDGKWYPSVTNIGIRPTIGNSKPRSETSVIGFSGDLYGKNIPVALLSFLRDEIRFSSLDELSAQIKKDSGKASEIFMREENK